MACFIVVAEPGSYQCIVKVSDNTQTSTTVNIVIDEDPKDKNTKRTNEVSEENSGK